MRLAIAVLTGWLALCWASPVVAQKKAPPGPAELLPADVIAYAEVSKPGLLAKEVRELFKGSVLYNVPDALAEWEAKHPGHAFDVTMSLKVMGLLLAPEVANELAKCSGMAGAFLGMSPEAHSEPEFVFILQPGSSNAATFLMRLTMTMAPLKAKETVEGVKIYRADRMHDPSLAMLKDYFFIGSHKAVKNCILRAKGKGEGDSLAQDKDFQTAKKKVGGEPGLFAFTRMSSLPEFMKQITKGAGPELAQFMEAYTRAINPKALRSSALSLSLQKGTLHYHDVVLLDPREKSPLLELLPSRAVATSVLHFAPEDAVLAVAVSNGDGEQRWDKLVKILDELLPAEALGGSKFSEVVQGAEKKMGVRFGPDVIGKTTNVGFAVGNPLNAPMVVTRTEGNGFVEESGSTQVPMVLILETADEKSAQALVESVSKLSQLAAKTEVKPQTRKVKGQSITGIKINPHASLEYGLAGNVVVIGPYAEGVAQALADGAAKKGLAANDKVLAQLKEFKDPIGVTVIKPGALVSSIGTVGGYKTRSRPPKATGPDGKELPVKSEQPGQPKITVSVQKDSPAQAKLKKELLDVLALEPWLVIGVTRGEDFVTREGKSPGWDKFVPKIVNFAAEKFLEHSPEAKPTTKPDVRPKEERNKD